MIIIGAGGMGQEILGILLDNDYKGEIIFFDENQNVDIILDKYLVIHNEKEIIKYLNNDNRFVVGIGHPRLREKFYKKFLKLGGKPISVISKDSKIFPNSKISEMCIIHPYVGISWGVEIGFGCVLHINCTIGHKVKLGKFVNIGPGANIIGPATINDYSYIGANSVILNNINIGKNVIINAGKIVDINLKDYETF